MNEVAAARALDGPKSKPKAPTKISKKQEVGEDDELEIDQAPAIGDEDDSKERQAALSSPMKGKDSQLSTAVSTF